MTLFPAQRRLAKWMRVEEWLGHVNNWRRWLLLIGFWLGSLAGVSGQTFALPESEGPVEEAPADGLVDRAGLGHRNPVLVAKLRENIRQLGDDHAFRLYIVLESVLVSGNPQLLASRLRRSWIPEGDGMVLVFEMDTRSLGIGQSFEQEVDPTKAPAGQVPSYETNAILENARAQVDAASAEAMLETFVTRLTEGYNEYFLRKDMPVSRERSVKMGLIIVGGAAALALLGLMAGLLVRRSDNRGGGRCFYFPEVQVSERLGAPYGGGEVSSRRFGRGGPP
ncbi:MAG: hypothetical protein EOP87_06200 [Verrucomicrobiaceae bacterium]|nr:MAG: hypothetical protein EOP87_06200 [Verrucomicrobiaceae bacterium]